MTKQDRITLEAQATDRVAVDLIEVLAPGEDAIRLCKHSTAVTSGGNVYSPAGMAVERPNVGESSGGVGLKISGVSVEYLHFAQTLAPGTEVKVVISLVFEDSPDEIVNGPLSLTVSGYNIDSATATITLKLKADIPLEYSASVLVYEQMGFPAIWT